MSSSPSSRSRDVAGHIRERVVANMNSRRERWANPLAPEEGYVCSQVRMNALAELAIDLAPFADSGEVSPIGDEGSPQGVKIGDSLSILRTLDKASQVFRWAGEEICTENGKKLQRRFPNTEAAVAFLVKWMTYDVAPADAPSFVGVLESFRKSPLFASPEKFEELKAEVTKNFPAPPGSEKEVSASDLEKLIDEKAKVQTVDTPAPF